MKKRILTVSFVLAIILVVAGVVLSFFGGKETSVTMKKIQVTVISNNNSQTYDIETDSKYLGEALLNEGLIKGENTQYGLFITEVAGIKADSDKEQWWLVTKNGEGTDTGVSSIEIADGEKYEFTLKVGYDN